MAPCCLQPCHRSPAADQSEVSTPSVEGRQHAQSWSSLARSHGTTSMKPIFALAVATVLRYKPTVPPSSLDRHHKKPDCKYQLPQRHPEDTSSRDRRTHGATALSASQHVCPILALNDDTRNQSTTSASWRPRQQKDRQSETWTPTWHPESLPRLSCAKTCRVRVT